jgi:hypothetical protein
VPPVSVSTPWIIRSGWPIFYPKTTNSGSTIRSYFYGPTGPPPPPPSEPDPGLSSRH